MSVVQHQHVKLGGQNLQDEARAPASSLHLVTPAAASQPTPRQNQIWLAGQGEALEAALNDAALETSLGILVRTTIRLLGEPARAAFYLANEEGTALHHVVGMSAEYAKAVEGFAVGPESLACGLAVHTGQAAYTPDVTLEPRWQPWLWMAQEFGYRACWSIPIHTSARRYAGTLAVYWPEPRAASETECEITTLVVQTASIIVSRHQATERRKRAEAAQQAQADRLRLLWEAATLMLTAEDPDAMLRGLFGKIGAPLGVDTYFNYVLDESGGLRLASWAGISDEVAATISHLDMGQAICGAAAQRREPIVASNIQQSDDPKAQLVKSLGIRAYACNVLLADQILLGTLSFASRSKDEFSRDDLAFLQTICQYVTVAYERLRLLKALRTADQRKDEFLATLAHELRNPLAPIANAVQILEGSSDEAQARWARGIIGRQVRHLTRLVDDLLDVSRITRNRLELRKQTVELATVIRHAVETSRPAIEQREQQLTVQLPHQPVLLEADEVRLGQVILNLLSNASKYTERGGKIELTAARQGNSVTISVRDTGIGIELAKLPRVFELFFQIDHSLEKAQSGLGIGLSLVQRLVELHDGRVEARSEGLGRGSEFLVHLPTLADTPQTLHATGQARAAHGTRRILVVDDNRDAADTLALLLTTLGNEAHVAYDGEAGIELARRVRPDAILVDIGMPGLNGYDTCRRLREDAFARNAKVVALTGLGHDRDRTRSRDAGFDGHLLKPVDIAALTSMLDHQPGAPL